jgi:hypothetical protein
VFRKRNDQAAGYGWAQTKTIAGIPKGRAERMVDAITSSRPP